MLFAVGEQRAVVPVERLLEIVVSGELVSLEVGVRRWEGRGGGSVALSNYRLTRRVGKIGDAVEVAEGRVAGRTSMLRIWPSLIPSTLPFGNPRGSPSVVMAPSISPAATRCASNPQNFPGYLLLQVERNRVAERFAV